MNKILLGGIVSFFLVASLASAQQTYGCPMSEFGYGNTFGWIFQILLIIALALFIAWLVKQLQNPKGGKRK
jgi:hypothetical protein